METTTPVCQCHGEPMYWHKKKDMRAGGLWRCRVRKREVQKNRRASVYRKGVPSG